MVVSQEIFGKTESGEEVIKYTIKNSNGLELDVISFGATFVSLKCPDRNGKIDDVVLGYDKLEDYLTNPPYFGATIGRVANRIANGKFSLGGKEYQLAINAPPNTLHGGWVGFNKELRRALKPPEIITKQCHKGLLDGFPGSLKSQTFFKESTGLHNWKSEVKNDRKVKFTYISPDGDENYPGELTARISFILTDNNEVKLHYKATTKAETIVNFTNHGYFNLAGQVDRDVLDHIALINAPTYLPTNDVQIPTGEKCSVSSPISAFDFTKPKHIGQDIAEVPGGGYDHNYCLPKSKKFCAEVYHPSSGRVVKMFTDQPGVQFYTGNGLDGSPGKGGVKYHKYGAFCLEAQNYPDAINQPDFPSPILHPGETYKQKTIYKFDVK